MAPLRGSKERTQAPGLGRSSKSRHLTLAQSKVKHLPSCPGSARARPAWQALPACGRSYGGRAARPLCSQAEPWNEKSLGTKAVRVGTRKTIPTSPVFTNPGSTSVASFFLAVSPFHRLPCFLILFSCPTNSPVVVPACHLEGVDANQPPPPRTTVGIRAPARQRPYSLVTDYRARTHYPAPSAC